MVLQEVKRGATTGSSLYRRLKQGLAVRIGSSSTADLDELLERLEFNGSCDDPTNREVFPTTCVCGMPLTSKVLYFSDPLTRATFNIGCECVKGLEREALRLKVATSIATHYRRSLLSPDFSIPGRLTARMDESKILDAAVMVPFRSEIQRLEKELGEVMEDKQNPNHDYRFDIALARLEFAICEAICLAYGKFPEGAFPIFFPLPAE